MQPLIPPPTLEDHGIEPDRSTGWTWFTVITLLIVVVTIAILLTIGGLSNPRDGTTVPTSGGTSQQVPHP